MVPHMALLVKSLSCIFQKKFESEETLRKCAESALASVIGDLSHTYFIGNAPMGHIVVQPTEDKEKTSFKALYQLTVLLILNFRGEQILHLEHETREHAVKVKNTLIFNAFVLCQVRTADKETGYDWLLHSP